MDESLEFFRLRGSEYGQLTGLNIAVHALWDAFMLMHCGVGCKHKTTSQLSTHDWARSVVDREGWTEVGDAELITGASDRIGPYLRSWYDRVEPSLIVVISVTFLDLTGEDLPFTVKENAETVPCPVIRVSAPGTHGDMFLGYQNGLVAVLRMLDWKQATRHSKEVAILGYWFDRYEGDHAGNLQQLQLLLKMLGLQLGAVAFSGTSFTKLQRIPQAEHLLVFPLLVPKIKRLQRVIKREMTVVPLPMGLRPIAVWLKTVAKATQTYSAHLEQLIQRKEEVVRKKLTAVSLYTKGKRVAICADLPHAVGLCAMLSDLGVEVVLVALRGQSLGNASDFQEALLQNEVPVSEDMLVLLDPSLHCLGEELGALIDLEDVDGIIASSTELNMVEQLPVPSLIPFGLEFGFPCKHYHTIRPAAYMGYTGILVLADRIVNAPSLRFVAR